jgi:hypothetical protein
VKHYGIFGVVQIQAKPLKTLDSFSGLMTLVPIRAIITPWMACRLARLKANENYEVTPLVIHTHEYIYPSFPHEEVVAANADTAMYLTVERSLD